MLNHFFQGMLVLGSMFIAPIFAAFMLDTSSTSALPGGYLNPFSSWQDIVSGLAWGLGYFGMPHIIIRFMSIKSQKDLKKSAKIGITWTLLIVFFATLIGVIGRLFLGFDESINENSLVFIQIVRKIFPGVISGILLSAVLAASMSTADSQLLAASSAFSSDVYKPVIRKGKASDKEMMSPAVLSFLESLLQHSSSLQTLMPALSWHLFPMHGVSLELPLGLQSCSASSGSALTSRVLLQES